MKNLQYFYILLLEQNTTKKGRVNKLLKLEPKLDVREDKKCKVEVIKDSAVYIGLQKINYQGYMI